VEAERGYEPANELRSCSKPELTNSGDSFVAGDVLLEIETDKAQMDVEAQDDGILAKIIVRRIDDMNEGHIADTTIARR
jgi:acetyl/propionyl-CoA carboxylase alpha subunit